MAAPKKLPKAGSLKPINRKVKVAMPQKTIADTFPGVKASITPKKPKSSKGTRLYS